MNEIILLEGTEDFYKIKKNNTFHNKQKIITFDFMSHKQLKKLQIKHEMIEEFISNEDEEFIDKKSFQMTIEWNQIEEISNLLIINQLNLGELLNHEMTDYFCKHLKRIIGITKVLEKEKPDKIICYSLSPYIKLFNKEKKIHLISFDYKLKTKLHDDQMHIPITISGKTYAITISRKTFLRIKRFLNKCTTFVLRSKPDYSKYGNWLLLLDFNTITYEYFFKIISKYRENIVLLNQRRPAIWNYKSMSIIRQTGIKITDLEWMKSRENKRKIEKLQKKVEKNIEEIFMNTKFINFFEINQHTFFDVIKNEFLEIIKKRFKESVQQIILIEEFFDKCNIGCILEWGHVSMEEKIVLHIAKQKKIPTIFLQHGVYVLNKKFEKYINHLPILPSENSKEAIWGETVKNYLLEHDIDKKDFFVTGSPRHDIFFKNIPEKQKSNLILILANNFSYINYTGRDTRAYEYLENSIIEIIRVLKIHKKKIVIKIHPGYSYYDIRPLIREIDPTIDVFQDQDVQSFLRKCDSVISLNYSTTLLEAMILQKPTLLILPDDQKFEEELPVKRNATLYVDKISKIEQGLEKILTDNDTRQKLISEGNSFVDDYFSHKGVSSKELLKILNNILNEK